VPKEAVQQLCSAAEAPEAAAGQPLQLIDRPGRGVQQVALHRAVAQLLRVQVRRVGWQPLDLVVVRVGGHEGLHRLRAVGVQAVPDDDEGPPDLPAEVAQRDDDLLPMEAAPEVAGVQPGGAVERGDQGDDAGDFAPLADPLQDRRPALRGPGGADAGPKRVTRLVQEGNRAPRAASPDLFTCG
jgi:hypothetical protein